MSANDLAPKVMGRTRGRKGKVQEACKFPKDDSKLLRAAALKLEVAKADVIYTGTMIYVHQVLQGAA